MGIHKKYSLGDLVWDDINRDGIQDSDEQGVKDIEVILLDSNGNEINRTKTDENGSYIFEDLDNGDYQVKFTIPDGYMVTAQNAGDDDTKDSDPDSDGTVNVTIKDNDDFTIDMGIHKKYSLGDYVWNDLNKNGIQDADEPGIANIEVELLDENGKSLAKIQQIPMENINLTTWIMEIIKLNSQFQKIMQLQFKTLEEMIQKILTQTLMELSM